MQTPDLIVDLQSMANTIAKFRESSGLTWAQMREQFPEFGSDKTLSKLQAGDTSELDATKWFAAYSVVVAQIEAIQSGETPDEDALAAVDGGDLLKLPLATTLRRMFLEMMKTRGPARLGVLLISGGGGKTSAARNLAATYRGRVRLIECLRVWDDRPGYMLRDIADKLHIKKADTRTNHALYRAVRDALKSGRKCLIFDEAHYLGPRCLSTLVNLINDTPGEFLFLGKPMLWANLERSAYAECDQLLVNRLHEKVAYARLSPDSYSKFLQARVPSLSDDDRAAVAADLARRDERLGHLAFARAVVESLPTGPATAETFKAAAIKVAQKLGKPQLCN